VHAATTWLDNFYIRLKVLIETEIDLHVINIMQHATNIRTYTEVALKYQHLINLSVALPKNVQFDLFQHDWK
jgi:hypothetical protein